MSNFIFAFVLLLLALGGVAVRKTYYQIPLAELKRRAERQDAIAVQLYKAVAYEASLRSLLAVFIVLTSAGSFVLLSHITSSYWLSFVFIVIVIWATFYWLPASRISALSERLTLLVTPIVTWLLSYLHPLLSGVARFVARFHTALKHTKIYEKEDLLTLLTDQQQQVDNRLSIEELEIMKRVLAFPDFLVRDVYTPRAGERTVHANETVGPILIDELHKTGLEYVLVQDSPDAEIVGLLAVHELGLKSSGHVRDLMDATVYYVHESDTLSDALHAFFVTNHPLFIVTNSFEEYVGTVSVQNILQTLLGHVPGDDFDQYSDRAAVANRHPKSKRIKKTPEFDAEVLE